MGSIDFVLLPPREASGDRQGCHEFRCWFRGPHPALRRLGGGWQPEDAEMREDIYILGAPERVLVKLRDGERLEIKRRHGGQGRMQYWTRPVSVRFPLDAETLRGLSLALGTPAVLEAGAERSPAHLLAACWSAQPRLSVVPVRKTRLVFRLGDRAAEVTRAAWNGRRATSVAVEDPDEARAAATVDELGLGGLENLSYAEVLRPGRIAARPRAVG